MSKIKQVEAIFISDVHLGSKGCNSKELLEILKTYNPKHLFIVGDFIDGWLLKKRHYWTQDFTNVIRKILSYSKKGTKVIYVTGNHDDFLRHYVPLSLGDNIEIVDEYIWNDYFITHGDLYDGVVQMKWLGILGSIGYEIAIAVDRFIKKLGVKKSLSKWLKRKVKNAVKFITAFETQLIYQSKKRNCKGVICGHIHTPENKIIDNIHYLNCGDWIESNSYIICVDNKFEIKYASVKTPLSN
jgi:UDP-2,3-diacylglucosamine pyrophosphatase LpxH